MTGNVKNNHRGLLIASISGIIVSLIMCFTGVQLGPFAPLIIAFGIYMALFFLLVLFGIGISITAQKYSSR